MPNYIHSIPNNNDNQDIVSMGTNSALITAKVIENAFQVTAIHLMALMQGVDCLDLKDKLAPATRGVYDQIRSFFPAVKEDETLYPYIAKSIEYIINNKPL